LEGASTLDKPEVRELLDAAAEKRSSTVSTDPIFVAVKERPPIFWQQPASA